LKHCDGCRRAVEFVVGPACCIGRRLIEAPVQSIVDQGAVSLSNMARPGPAPVDAVYSISAAFRLWRRRRTSLRRSGKRGI
jgi:hypothetical protein